LKIISLIWNRYTVQMWGTPYLHSITVPNQASQPAGEQLICDAGESRYTTNTLNNTNGYTWELSPAEAGELTPNGVEVNIVWSQTFAGEAMLRVSGENQCGSGEFSEALSILLSDTPTPIVEGPTQTCDYTEEVYSVTAVAGNLYNWEIEGGYITAGAGTAQVSVMWTDPGTGTINLTEATPENCEGVAVPVTVIIDNCTGIEEADINAIRIYPNPVTSLLNIGFEKPENSEVTVRIINSFGQLVWMQEHQVTEATTQLQINTNEWNKGYYVVEINDGTTRVVKRTFVKL